MQHDPKVNLVGNLRLKRSELYPYELIFLLPNPLRDLQSLLQSTISSWVGYQRHSLDKYLLPIMQPDAMLNYRDKKNGPRYFICCHLQNLMALEAYKWGVIIQYGIKSCYCARCHVLISLAYPRDRKDCLQHLDPQPFGRQRQED